MAPPPAEEPPPSTPPKKKSFLTYLVIFFYGVNGLLFLSGCCVVGIGIWIILFKRIYANLVKTECYSIIQWVLIAIMGAFSIVVAMGVYTMIVAVVGPLAVWFRNKCIQIMYILSLLLIYLVELALGFLAIVYMNKVELSPSFFNQSQYNLSQYGLTSTTENYEMRAETTTAIEGYETTTTIIEGYEQQYMFIIELFTDLKHVMFVIGAAMLVVSIIPIVGVVLGCWIYILMKKHAQFNGHSTVNQNPM